MIGFNLRQRKAKLYNGEVVREGDIVEYTDSDGNTLRLSVLVRKHDYNRYYKLESFKKDGDQISLRKGTLYIGNPHYQITDYINARKVTT